MKIGIQKTVEVNAKTVKIHVKVSDSGSYELCDQDGEQIAERNDYVPRFFPEEHYGDYLILEIELDSGRVLNWEPPSRIDIEEAFFPKEE